jgi:hypothetical protein
MRVTRGGWLSGFVAKDTRESVKGRTAIKRGRENEDEQESIDHSLGRRDG